MFDGHGWRIVPLWAILTISSAAFAESSESGGSRDAATQPAAETAGQTPHWLDTAMALSTGAEAIRAVSSSPAESPTTQAAQTQPAKHTFPRMVPWVDYSGDLWHRPALTGDWGGLRQKMMDQGIRFSADLTQSLQGNLSGGVSKRAWYQGNMRYDLDFDTDYMGLWPGGMVHIRGETPYGKDDNQSSGAIMPVNTAALYPFAPETETCLSEAYYMQFVAPWLGFIGGKMAPRERNVFAHDETTQFSNIAFNFNTVSFATVPQDFLAAGVFVNPAEWFNISTFVLDSEGQANVSGFDTVFDRGTTVYQMVELGIKPFEQSGHQRVSWSWSDKSRIELRQDPRVIVRDVVVEKLGLGSGPNLKRQGNDWSVMYDFDQYLYTKPGTADQGFGLFGRFGVSDGVVNPAGQFYSIGLGGKGMIPSREFDTYGIGFYYLVISDKIGPVLTQRMQDENGVEVYYNIQVTPWVHVTPDLQVIEPGRSLYSDTAVVAGLRVRIDF